jgi:hypothetical protein
MASVIVIQSPLGPITVVAEGDGVFDVSGTSGFGIDGEGKPFHAAEGPVPSAERAYLTLDNERKPFVVSGG